jgi:hypothetical protein
MSNGESTMKPEQQRIKISEACGWKLIPALTGQNPFTRPVWYGPKGGPARNDRLPPNYLNSLDAMHEAEKVLTGEQAWKQIKLIVGYAQCAGGFPVLSRSESLRLHSATAAQRAEAFLRTIGKWEA